MKLGILISKSGAFLFEMPGDDIIITDKYIIKTLTKEDLKQLYSSTIKPSQKRIYKRVK